MLLTSRPRVRLWLCASLVCALFASACSSIDVRRPTKEENLSPEDVRDRRGGKIGRAGKPDDKAFSLFSFGKRKKKQKQNNALASANTNAYLWQGALQTIDFMPLLSSDFAGGVIATDWYTPPESPRRRYRMTVRIEGTAFRADALKVTVFTQNLTSGRWSDEKTDNETARQIEETMLTRARDLLADANL